MIRTYCLVLAIVAMSLSARPVHARNLMSADGPGNTYPLLQQAYTVETPDCGHMVPHVTEEMDAELGKPVFVFHAHVAQDDDRCGAQDRQRTEIRARAADIVASNGQTVYYNWKFKLATGFQASPSFTHIFQIKSDQAAPVMTLTPRTSTFAIDGRIGARGTTSLAKFIGHWVVVDLKVVYSNAGSVEATIRKLNGGEVLFQYSGAADMWDDGASGHDSKFGIYRSLNNRGDLRDEQVRFADFCASKVSSAECADGALPPPPPPSDAGAGSDGGTSDAVAVDGRPVREDAGPVVTPDTAPPIDVAPTPPAPSPDASGGSPTPRPPRPDAAPPTPAPTGGDPASGCSCDLSPSTSGGSSGAALGLVVGALLLIRRRRRSAT